MGNIENKDSKIKRVVVLGSIQVVAVPIAVKVSIDDSHEKIKRGWWLSDEFAVGMDPKSALTVSAPSEKDIQRQEMREHIKSVRMNQFKGKQYPGKRK